MGAALEARQIPASNGRLVSEVTGEIERTDDGVLVIRRVHVLYRLRADPERREAIDRVLGFHARKCPVARTIGDCVDISTELELIGE
ncbi:MAG: hypothetical protein ACRDIX_03830 [Actinomycetota bacterium]